MAKNTPSNVLLRQQQTCLFNASVVLAGLKSPAGGSGKLLLWIRQAKIKGVISEIILDEVIRNAKRIGFTQEDISRSTKEIFTQISPAPKEKTVEQFKERVLDLGDAHVLASAKEEGVSFLVTLDKKHLLVLKSKIKIFKIVSPAQLIELFN